ncbi:MAG TPA: class I SAM-dependent methyltransferase [Miltoncostaeaceae bacterium]|nr:class I SAM-dependent methyltransferase [Miltoncostaeaceae bacterium]
MAASRTAVLVCQGRAVANGRLGGFVDPTAARLLRPPELAVVERIRAGARPQGWRGLLPYELVLATAELMAARSLAIDAAAAEADAPQLVILGAGLDGRAWRLPWLDRVAVFEVDLPASQADKRERVGDLRPTAGRLAFVAVDLARGRLDAALEDAGHDRTLATTWIWEGVVPYMSGPDVAATLGVVAFRSAPGSRLVVSYQSPSVGIGAGRLLMRALMRLGGEADPLADEPWRSSWRAGEMAQLLGRHRFAVVSDEDLLTVAERYAIPARRGRSLAKGRVAVADFRT